MNTELTLIAILLFTIVGFIITLLNWKQLRNITSILYNSGARIQNGRLIPLAIAGSSNNDKSIVVNLYSASWCGACKYFRPTWDTWKTKYAQNPSVSFNEVDCSDNTIGSKIAKTTALKNDEKIQGWPTVTVSVNGDVEEKFAGPGETVEQLVEKLGKLIK